MSTEIAAEHGVICWMGNDPFGYFGWPSIARLDDNTLVVASSGLRTEHVCPFGKTVLNYSRDEGRSWSAPIVVNDTFMDDRDAGVVNLGGKSMLVSWFTSDTRKYREGAAKRYSAEVMASWDEVLDTWTDAKVDELLGSWVTLTDDGESWTAPIRVPVSTPHGPIRLANGDLLYLGKANFSTPDRATGVIMACRSSDGGRTWAELGEVPACPGASHANVHEPHVAELADGRLVGMIRFQRSGPDDPVKDQINFSLSQTESDDGGETWSIARPTGVYGSPPGLLAHSSGALLCVYGYRQEPYGQRAMVSRDGGQTWGDEIVLRDDGPDGDLGYPDSVEMPDGSVMTIYYQKSQAGEKCSLLYTRWQLPL